MHDVMIVGGGNPRSPPTPGWSRAGTWSNRKNDVFWFILGIARVLARLREWKKGMRDEDVRQVRGGKRR